MVMLNNQMVSLKVSWEISMSLIQHQQADSPRRFSWWPIAWEKDQFSPVTSAVVMWSQKKGLGKPSDISMSLSFCRATKTHTHTFPTCVVGGYCIKVGTLWVGWACRWANCFILNGLMAGEALGRRCFDGKSKSGFHTRKFLQLFPETGINGDSFGLFDANSSCQRDVPKSIKFRLVPKWGLPEIRSLKIIPDKKRTF